jgi:hypothetical protein
MTVTEARKTLWYRFFESLLGIVSVSFVFLIFFLPFWPNGIVWVSIFMILYGLFWIFKLTIITVYTLYTYKQLKRWSTLNFKVFFELFDSSKDLAIDYLKAFRSKYSHKLDWQEKLTAEIQVIKTSNLKPKDVLQVALFTIYNEPAQVLVRSLNCIYKTNYYKNRLIVVISQEAGNGNEKNKALRDSIQSLDWVKMAVLKPYSLDELYQKHTTEFFESRKKTQFTKLDLDDNKLNVFFTEHPDNLIGEIRGKASNEDWGARNVSLFLEDNGFLGGQVLLTSLDSDSHVAEDFFANLTYKFIASKDRLDKGFQPVHVYSNNFFNTGFWPRQIATQTTLDNMGRIAVHGDAALFAIYSLSLNLLRRADFWERELIAEDSVLTIRCLKATQGKFLVNAHYGVLEGDAVEDDDYIDAIISQYKQLKRWSWGGVESIPYIIKELFVGAEAKFIDTRVKLRWLFLLFSNHIFWATTPIIFSAGILFPQLVGSQEFRSTQIAQNLSTFAQYFAWLSMFFLSVFSVLIFRFIVVKAGQHTKITWQSWYLIIFQILISPLLYFFMGIPAFDAQIRGIFGKYMSYVVTPKK